MQSLRLTTDKQALSYATTRTANKISHINSIATCTYGILFFGTPHHGSSKARLLGTLQKLASLALPSAVADFEPGLVSALQEESETLQNITDYFVPLMKNYCIYFFWEQEKTSMAHGKDYIVTEASAAPVYDDTERAGIAANHSDMNKFDSNRAPGFRVVAAALAKYCEEAPAVIRRRNIAMHERLSQERREEAFERLRRIQPIDAAPGHLNNFALRPIKADDDVDTTGESHRVVVNQLPQQNQLSIPAKMDHERHPFSWPPN